MATILIVDDSRTMRSIATQMLTGTGLVVSEAEDGAQALAACAAAMPDAVLLDWNMPVMDGPAFLAALREMPGGRTPKVVFCTTESDIGKITEGLSLGADEFIMKPYDAEILHFKLASVGLMLNEAA
jgi:two-component system chemotaxis response regulator CheY